MSYFPCRSRLCLGESVRRASRNRRAPSIQRHGPVHLLINYLGILCHECLRWKHLSSLLICVRAGNAPTIVIAVLVCFKGASHTHTDTDTDRQTDRHTHTHTHTHTHAHTHRHTRTHTHTHTHTHTQSYSLLHTEKILLHVKNVETWDTSTDRRRRVENKIENTIRADRRGLSR